jgi:DNA polymerase-1
VISDRYRGMVLMDKEYYCPDGERPREICTVWHEVLSGEWGEAWTWEGGAQAPSAPSGGDVLFMSHSLPAEFSCILTNGGTPPTHAVDTLTEHKVLNNGTEAGMKTSLLNVLIHLGLDPADAAEKDAGRELAMRGGPFSGEELQLLLRYCRHDVESLRRIVLRMWDEIDWPRAVYRGRYGAAVAKMRHQGMITEMLLDVVRARKDLELKPELAEELARAIVVKIQNVAEYFYLHEKREWDLRHDLPAQRALLWGRHR